MENVKKKKINLVEIYPVIQETIDNGGNVQLPVTGKSMYPLLHWGRDSVELVKCEKPERGDIIFYLRDNGQFVLHRIIGTDEKGYVLCGDNQWHKEYGIQDHHIIAVVKSITRKGKKIEMTNIPYRIYSKIWMVLMPLRRFIIPVVQKSRYYFKKVLLKLGLGKIFVKLGLMKKL